ncbi:MAG TPA: DNA polymerase ligase N-terminal domain-containing protein [Sandaracinaceae bacterium LLY-WYZ-13_1]|nr:DNA polymerase ligase N-terminal domain-containing protein [Sandaracinaceae bacterium LLY-WYZ-13_1]
MTDRLKTYRDRRDFARSPEPSGGRQEDGWKKHGNPIFVIQEHDASSHHFDLRLEVDGALASWAVPKGPSLDPGDKRLAVRTEDHPMDYADFEGVIPEDEYGGGTVIVWDAGPYRNESDKDGEALSVADALELGHVRVWLEGKKLRGGFSLVHARPGGDEDAWLLIKHDDDGADARREPTNTEPKSVLSERTIDAVRDAEAG